MGVGEDWDLGYRNKMELEKWKKYDIIESPNVISVDKDFVQKKSFFYQEEFLNLFKDCMQYPEPEIKDLLNNVY